MNAFAYVVLIVVLIAVLTAVLIAGFVVEQFSAFGIVVQIVHQIGVIPWQGGECRAVQFDAVACRKIHNFVRLRLVFCAIQAVENEGVVTFATHQHISPFAAV